MSRVTQYYPATQSTVNTKSHICIGLQRDLSKFDICGLCAMESDVKQIGGRWAQKPTASGRCVGYWPHLTRPLTPCSTHKHHAYVTHVHCEFEIRKECDEQKEFDDCNLIRALYAPYTRLIRQRISVLLNLGFCGVTAHSSFAQRFLVQG